MKYLNLKNHNEKNSEILIFKDDGIFKKNGAQLPIEDFEQFYFDSVPSYEVENVQYYLDTGVLPAEWYCPHPPRWFNIPDFWNYYPKRMGFTLTSKITTSGRFFEEEDILGGELNLKCAEPVMVFRSTWERELYKDLETVQDWFDEIEGDYTPSEMETKKFEEYQKLNEKYKDFLNGN